MNSGEIILYQPNNSSIQLDVRIEEEPVWLTQAQIAVLFGTKRPAITKHLSNSYKSGELLEQSTCSILEHMGNDGIQKYKTRYNRHYWLFRQQSSHTWQLKLYYLITMQAINLLFLIVFN